MTNEEVERAIDFLLKSQANLEARIEQTNEQLGSFADTQREFMRAMTLYMESTAAQQARAEEAQARVNESLRASQARAEESQARINESLRASIIGLAARQEKTEEALVRLADAEARTERRLESLTKIVEEERGR